MSIAIRNLYQPTGAPSQESFETLVQSEAVRVEQISSHGHASPPGFWYDQEQDEWVALLKGTATLEFADAYALELVAGDSLTIPARMRHRVARTSPDAVWLAVHFAAARTPSSSAK